MTLYLLDTSILSHLVRNADAALGRVIRSRADTDLLCTSIIVAAELRFGAAKAGSRALSDRIDAALAIIEPRPFEAPADVQYAEIRGRLERLGTPIGANDLLIAAHALALGATLVTDNEREFRRVPGLAVENWLRF